MTGVGIPPIFLLLLAMTSACLITNCPRGGKRSGARPAASDSTTKELPFCTPCGPAELGGLCFGPKMCCSPIGGCEFGGPNAATCLGIHTIPPLCRMPPQSMPLISQFSRSPTETRTTCGAGICMGNGLCCASDWCHADERCSTPSEPSSNANLIVADHNLSSNLRQDSQETAFKDWHS